MHRILQRSYDLPALELWLERLVSFGVDTSPLPVRNHQVIVRPTLVGEERPPLVQNLFYRALAAFGDEGVNDWVASFVFNEFNVRGAHDLEHIGLCKRVRVYLGTSVEVADSVQLTLIARTFEAHVREHGKGMESCDQVVLV